MFNFDTSRFAVWLERKFIDPDMPRSLPMRNFGAKDGEFTWEDWHAKMRKEKPIRWFIFYTIPKYLIRKIIIPIDYFIYWFKSNTYKKYHLLDLRQPKTSTCDDYNWGWIDQDHQLVFACFNILVKFIESQEKSNIHYSISGIERLKQEIEESTDEIHKDFLREELKFLEELKILYNYWKFVRKELYKQQDKILLKWKKNKKNEKILDELHNEEDKFYKLEEDMLIRLIKIKNRLWL